MIITGEPIKVNMKEPLIETEPEVTKVVMPKEEELMPFKHKRQMIAMLLSKSPKTVATAKKWLKKYGPPTKK